MQIPLELIHIQIGFAIKYASIKRTSLKDALQNRTSLNKYNDVTHLIDSDCKKSAQRLFQLQKSGLLPKTKTTKNYSRLFGPFRYVFVEEKKELHIHITFDSINEALSLLKNGYQQLRSLFAEVKSTHPNAQFLVLETTILSKSFWKTFIPYDVIKEGSAALTEDHPILKSDALWSQFIDFKHRPKNKLIAQFLTAIDNADTIDDLLNAFPRQPIIYKGPIEFYYVYYKL